MQHTKWNIDHKTVLPISLRPKYINDRNEIGHLEIDSIVGRRNEYESIISIVDRCTRKIWLIKAEYKQEYYIDRLIYNYIIKNDIKVKSITTDNGIEFTYNQAEIKKEHPMDTLLNSLNIKHHKIRPRTPEHNGKVERSHRNDNERFYSYLKFYSFLFHIIDTYTHKNNFFQKSY